MTEQNKRSKLLIVDDEPDNIWILVKYLEDKFDIFCASDGIQALKIARASNRPDLILLDVMMPGIDGYEVCKRLKSDNSTSDIPIIFLTGKTAEIAETTGLELGAQDFITKPFSLPVVYARINSVINLKREMDRRLLLKDQMEQLNSQMESQVRKKKLELEKIKKELSQYEEKYNRMFTRKATKPTVKRILAVDDTPENIHIIINSLQDQYEIICATDGETALKVAFSDKPPDLILLDIMMPGMDGFEVCSRLKGNPETREIPIIFVTAMGQEIDEAKGLNYGAVDFITKPFSVPILEARIRAALRLKDALSQRIRLTRELEGLNKSLEDRVLKKTQALQQANKNLQASEQKYKDIYENAPEGIFQASFAGRFLNANPAFARMLGYESPDELLAKLTDIQHQLYVNPEERDILLTRLSKKSSVTAWELQFYRKDRQCIWVSASIRFVRDDSGTPLYIEGFVTDITERKLLEAQLHQAVKMEAIGVLVGGVAHDFNNMMTPVIGFSELLLNNLKEDDPSYHSIELIKKAGESAATLTRRLLGFSRKQVLQTKVINLNEAVSLTEKMLEPMIGKDIKMHTMFDHKLKQILADPGQIEQVIMNLAVNARDAMPQGGKLTISTNNVQLDNTDTMFDTRVSPGSYVMLAVSDTGSGIDDKTLGKIFEPFFTTKTRDKGTGLGLATVKGIVKQSRGYITAESRVAEGSTFKAYFPAVDSETVEQLAEVNVPDEYKGSETIMLAEDNPGVRALAIEILCRQGYTVLAEDSGKRSLEEVAAHDGPIDLLLTDVLMPDMSGLELFQQISLKSPALKTIYMSGYADDVIPHHDALGQDISFLQKPFSVQGLLAKVRGVLDS